jgi:hypothetical protein
VATVLGALVGISAAVRFLLALPHSTPLYFADEYIYSTLAYELATTGRPTVRGEAASFPALLWLFGDAGVALRLTQGLNALAMSLAAIPVYLVARKLALGKGFSLGAAALALLVPDFFYVAYVLGEPIAYPLVLGAVYAGVCALSAPTRCNQLAFFALSGLATFARIQFVVLPLAFLGAALIMRTPLRRLRLSLALFALPAVAVAVKGLGYYSGLSELEVDGGEILHWLATDSMLLAYAAGWLIVPGALVGLALPRTREERASPRSRSCSRAGSSQRPRSTRPTRTSDRAAASRSATCSRFCRCLCLRSASRCGAPATRGSRSRCWPAPLWRSRRASRSPAGRTSTDARTRRS